MGLGSSILMFLYRPVNQAELDLVKASDWLAFPPRLPEQPIFYPVTNLAYACKISLEWNVPAYKKSYVLKFEVADDFLKNYEIQNVGGEGIDEYWIPAQDLPLFNANILQKIEIVETHEE